MENTIKAVLFDLDGVLVSTDDQHFAAWDEIAKQEGVPFDRKDNDRLRGVSRMESLEILLGEKRDRYSPCEKQALAEEKNKRYRELIQKLTRADILPGGTDLLISLRKEGLKLAVGSSSKNAPEILERIGLADAFDVIVSGLDICNSKPDPEVYLLAARKLGAAPETCLVVEDAQAGIDAAEAAGMRSLGIGAAAGYGKSTICRPDLSGITAQTLLELLKGK